VGKFGLTEAWIALALLFLIFAEYLGGYIVRRVLAPRKSATRKTDALSPPAPPVETPETGP